jgi:hypothetical protein
MVFLNDSASIIGATLLPNTAGYFLRHASKHATGDDRRAFAFRSEKLRCTVLLRSELMFEL